MKVRYTETSLIEIDEIFSYIAERNPPAAAMVVARVKQTIANLCDFPELAQEVDEANVRRMPLVAILSSSSTRSNPMRS